jgi:methionyl-tRNA synthetase
VAKASDIVLNPSAGYIKATAPTQAPFRAKAGAAPAQDVAWAPVTPPGHTEFSWRSKQPQASSSSPSSIATTPSSTPNGEILPQAGRRNVLITSALPYVNNVPHLGNIIGCVLSADVYARFCRLRGYNTLYICGTDEYGTATETKAIQANMTPQQICDKFHVIHKEIYDWFDIKFDKFGRTTTKEQTIIAQDIFNKNMANGNVRERDVSQLWCEKFGFLADRFVEGTCPKCKYTDARGDQCDACGTLLNAIELENPRAKLDPSVPVLTKISRHLFLDLPALSDQLQAFVDKSSVKGGWSGNSIQTTAGWLRDGLKERCITRDLKWGTPVPAEGFEDKVFYVWFDAPIGYLSITANYTKEWERWWKNPDEVELVQFMGKDNIPFHTVIFPSSLIGTQEKYTMLHHINTTEYLNFDGGKFSKSRGVGVFGDDAKSTNIPAEVWRYYLLVNRPEQADTMFTWEDFAAKNNNELLNNLGNFVNRILAFTFTRFEGKVPAYDNKQDPEFVGKVAELVGEYVAHLDGYKLKNALQTAMQLSRAGNQFMQENQPWVLIKSDKARCEQVLGVCINTVYQIAILLQPYMPEVARKISSFLNFPISDTALASGTVDALIPVGHIINKPELLFRTITEDEVAALRTRFAGSQDERDAGTAGPTMPVALVVGLVQAAKAHPDSETLFVLTVDCGEASGPRTICSGLRATHTEAQLVGTRLVVLTNGKKADFHGIESDGMVLSGDKKKKPLTLLTIAGEVAPGTPCIPKGGKSDAKPDFDIRAQFKKLEFKTDKEGNVLFEGEPLEAGGLAVQAVGISGGKIK